MRQAVSFIIIAHKNAQTLPFCLDSVESQSIPQDELILVLNNPDAQTKSAATNRTKWRVFYENQQGPQHARNCGASLARNNFLCFLDADILIGGDWTSRMLSNFSFPWVVAGQSRIKPQKGRGIVDRLKRYQQLKFSTRFYFSEGRISKHIRLSFDTAAFMIRRDFFKTLGGFDPDLSRLEDTDLSYRVLNHGGDVFYEDRVFALELIDPAETLFEFIRKRYISMTLLPLLLKKHHMNYYFPLSRDSKREITLFSKKLPRVFIAFEYLFYLLELVGVANSLTPVLLFPTHFIVIKGNQKKAKILGIDTTFIRTVWIGGQERWYDLSTSEYTKIPK